MFSVLQVKIKQQKIKEIAKKKLKKNTIYKCLQH